MKSTLTAIGAAAAVAMAGPALADANLAADAIAEDNDNGWVYVAYQQDVDDDDRDRVVDYQYNGSMVFTRSTEELGVVFTCSDRHGLGASVGLRPLDFSVVFENTSRRARRKTVEARFGDDEPVYGTWIQLPSVGTVEPREPRLRRKIYNAVIKGESLTLKLDGRDSVTISFPPVDENFTRWAMECPVTKPK